MKKYVSLFLVAVLSLFLISCSQADTAQGTSHEKSTEITVAAAASLTDAMKEIGEIYQEKNPSIKITFNFASSGSLMNQIEEGAPVDLFFSAASKQMDQLQAKNLIDENTRKNILENDLVLITPEDQDHKITSFEDLATQKVKKIALGNPESVPAGQYSKEIIHYLGIENQIENKIVEATDVRQVLSWVETGEVDCGIVYSTDAKTSDSVEMVAKAPKDSHTPVIYPAALLKESKNLEQAQKFLDFLSTKEAGEIFETYGFDTI
ncbi:molybdate ABC transporter substrate-binding protein [Garciella nitratireducens]|uniref:Molybdate transport system substrate-binding protein n=1 Tax=Garciella nitratireducens DSM 15102 TaxID=1121911 RepID=A0A1T4LWM0_9FIRM|nr:molybdate ABC transporter substrate-binding protein [Garciella nitratireducens]SJZ58834.1 molybdate transport system substrate-binding protein [Garciella nitratireducens DSM 15102]